MMVDLAAIDAVELISVRLSPDRKQLRLRVRDQMGRAVSLSLPTSWLDTLLNGLPRQVESGTLHSLDSWTLDCPGNGRDLIPTLRTPEGRTVSFVTKRWQVEGMATIAKYGSVDPGPSETVH